MNSYYMKAHILSYLRFNRRCMNIATECGDYLADILAYNGHELFEVEIKTSYSDFLADFKKKKHRAYKINKSKWIPHRFYFAVPDELVEKCAIYIKEKKLKYGLISISANILHGKKTFLLYTNNTKTPIKIKKPAQKLHEKIICESITHKIMRRMSSELCQRTGELFCNP